MKLAVLKFFVVLIVGCQQQQCHCQLLSNQPYFRGILSAVPVLNTNLLPTPSSASSRPLVTIGDGILQGFVTKTVKDRDILTFLSIPYAQPPVGLLRFQDPIKNLPWNGTLDASRPSPQCIQIDFVQLGIVHGEEDCLYLNVYTPPDSILNNTKYPVMVFFHGGAFSHGAGSSFGPRYLLDHNIILVTFNYRLGPFGFFSTGDSASPGNQGLKDQVVVLKWVRDNIFNFGRDPNSVTIFGQSAGASSVGLHLISPQSRNLFHRAILHSSSAQCYMAGAQKFPEVAYRVGEVFNCPTNSSQEMVHCLRQVPAKLLAPVQLKFAEWFVLPFFWFTPTIEHDHSSAFMTMTPEEYYESGQAQNVPIIAGLTKDEMSLHVSFVINNLILVNDVNNNWDKVGPTVLELNYNTTELQLQRISDIWDFYMGNQKLEWDTRHQFGEMLSDRHLTECGLQTMRYHSKYTNSSVFGYRFSYHGRYSFVQQGGNKPEDWGVVHGDDLIYLLDNPEYYSLLNIGDPEMEMSELMTNIWSNFATYDNPYLGTETNLREVWQPIVTQEDEFSALRFLDLKLQPEMINDPYTERYRFWRDTINPNP